MSHRVHRWGELNRWGNINGESVSSMITASVFFLCWRSPIYYCKSNIITTNDVYHNYLFAAHNSKLVFGWMEILTIGYHIKRWRVGRFGTWRFIFTSPSGRCPFNPEDFCMLASRNRRRQIMNQIQGVHHLTLKIHQCYLFSAPVVHYTVPRNRILTRRPVGIGAQKANSSEFVLTRTQQKDNDRPIASTLTTPSCPSTSEGACELR